jgi:hypothetical protein
MNRQDWLLLVLASSEKALTPVQLQKSLFLLEKTLPNDLIGEDYYDFVPFDYGPFDSDIYQDAEELAGQQLATVVPSMVGRWQEYSIRLDGLDRARVIQEELPANVQVYVRNLVEWVQSKSFPQLVRFVYEHYPEYKVNSVFQD